MDNILIQGAKAKGLGNAAIKLVEEQRDRLSGIVRGLKYINKHEGTVSYGDVKETIKNQISGIQKNAAGYMLELAFVYAFISANEKCLGQMINLGGRDIKLPNKIDPRLQEDYEKLKNAIKIKQGEQTKADFVFNLHEQGVFGTTSWTGFQAKSYADISSIHVGSYTLGEILNTYNIYSDDFLVNIAGGITDISFGPYANIIDRIHAALNMPNKKSTKGVTFRGLTTSDSASAAIAWGNIKTSLNLLGVVDAVAGSEIGTMVDKVNYYVIRNKETGLAKVIGVSKILNRIKNLYFDSNKKGLGISLSAKGNKDDLYERKNFEKINADNFDPNDETGWNRSSKSFSEIYNKILETKVHISLDFSKIFI